MESHVDDNIELNSIFIFSISDQSLTINNQSVDLSSMISFLKVSILKPHRLPCVVMLCPMMVKAVIPIEYSVSIADCLMKTVLNTILMSSIVNYLSDLTDLSVTSFSGSYIVDAFEIGIDSQATVVPLPGTLVLYATALAVFVVRRKPYKCIKRGCEFL